MLNNRRNRRIKFPLFDKDRSPDAIGAVCVRFAHRRLCLTVCVLVLLAAPLYADELGNICVVFVVDSSGSMNDIFPEVTNALVGFVESTRDGDMVVILNFDDAAHLYSIYKVDAYLREFAKEMLTDKRFLSPRRPGTGQTQIILGLRRAYQLIERLEKNYSYPSYAIILLTDGDHYPLPNPYQWQQLMDDLKQKQWSRFAVSLKRESDGAVQRIADEFGGDAFYYDKNKPEDLKRILDSIRKRILIELEVNIATQDFGRVDAGKVYTFPIEINSSSEHSVTLSSQIKQQPFEADESRFSFQPEQINIPENVVIKLETLKRIATGDYAGTLRFQGDKTVILKDKSGQTIDGISFRFHVNSWWEKYGTWMVCLAFVSSFGVILLILFRPKPPVVQGLLRVLRSPDNARLPEGKSFQLSPMKKTVVKVGRERGCDVRLELNWISEVQFQLIAEGKKMVKLNRLNGTVLVENREVYHEKRLARENRIILRQEPKGEKDSQQQEIELQYRNPALPRKI